MQINSEHFRGTFELGNDADFRTSVKIYFRTSVGVSNVDYLYQFT